MRENQYKLRTYWLGNATELFPEKLKIINKILIC